MPDFAGSLDASIVGPAPQGLAIELGRVGWFPDTSDHAAVSDDDIHGTTLVKVTLVRGGLPDDVPPEGEARGMQIRARVLGPQYYVPPVGTEVLVAFPGGFQQTPGSAVILGTLGATPSEQYSATKAKLDYGPDCDVVLKGRSVTLVSYNDATPTGTERMVAVGPDTGIQILDEDGFGMVIKDQAVTIFAPNPADQDAKSIVRLTKDQLTLANKDGGNNVCSITLKDQEVCAAGLVCNTCAPGTNLGSAATAATPAITGFGTAATFAEWALAFNTWATAVAAAVPVGGRPIIAPPLPVIPLVASTAVNIQP